MEPLAADDPREVGGYRLIGLLGVGGMARVFLGRAAGGGAAGGQVAGGQVAAIKVIHPDHAKDPEYMQRFRHEVRVARAVSGQYIASVIAAGADDSPPWLATEFVPGPSLREVISAGPLATAAVWALADGLVRALQTVHAPGLVHRDLTPGNVLLASDGPRLIDFGIAKVVTASTAISTMTSLTHAGVGIGTPGFMSPEQIGGLKVGPGSDIFSLGSVIVLAASGRRPFGEGDPLSVAIRVINAEPDLSGVIPADLRRLVSQCLAKDSRERPTLSQLLAAIASGRASAPVSWSGSFWPDPLAAVVSRREDSYRQYLAQGSQGQVGSPWNDASQSTVTVRGLGGRDGRTVTAPAPATAPAADAGPAAGPGTARTVRQRSAGNPAAAELARRGDRLCARREFTQAEDAFRESIGLEADPVVHNDLGRVLAQMGRFMEAEEQFRAAVKLAPDYIEPWQNLCRALHTMDRYHEAADACEEMAGLGGCCGLRRRPPRKGR
jgi:serine/threonine protein kinase